MLFFPITELDVQALIDSQLKWEDEKRILHELAKNKTLYSYYRQMIEQKKLLISWWLNDENKK